MWTGRSWGRRVHPYKCAGDVCPAGGGAGLHARAGGGRAGELSFSACFHRRGVWLAGRGRCCIHGRDGVFAEQSLLGVEGGIGSPGSRLPPHLRAENADDELLEQLWAVPVSGEADSAGHPERADGQAAADLWRRANVRDWLYVGDHCEAIQVVLDKGRPGETYNIGGNNEKANLEVVETVCSLLDELQPNSSLGSYRSLITFVKDRPGHDRRYAIERARLRESWDGSRARRSRRACARRWSGT